jgi:hypothetical protein
MSSKFGQILIKDMIKKIKFQKNAPIKNSIPNLKQEIKKNWSTNKNLRINKKSTWKANNK